MTYFFCFDILRLCLEQDTALPFSNKVESILQFSLNVTLVSSHTQKIIKQSTLLCYKYLLWQLGILTKTVCGLREETIQITTHPVDNIQNNLLIFLKSLMYSCRLFFGSNSKAELEALALYISRTFVFHGSVGKTDPLLLIL